MRRNRLAGYTQNSKLNFYRSIFRRFETREASLTAVETFCVEVIHARSHAGPQRVRKVCEHPLSLTPPTKIKIFQASSKKDTFVKEQSPVNKRESILLMVTDKFYQFLYNITRCVHRHRLGRIREYFSPEEIAVLE